jgi:hypothetical protein
MQFQTTEAAATMTTIIILLLDAIKYRSSSKTFFLALNLEQIYSYSLWMHITLNNTE